MKAAEFEEWVLAVYAAVQSRRLRQAHSVFVPFEELMTALREGGIISDEEEARVTSERMEERVRAILRRDGKAPIFLKPRG